MLSFPTAVGFQRQFSSSYEIVSADNFFQMVSIFSDPSGAAGFVRRG
jgi:hypothetical protein